MPEPAAAPTTTAWSGSLPRPTRRRARFRGVAPPPSFSLKDIPPDAVLSTRETSALTRLSIAQLDTLRHTQPDHPLRWFRVNARTIRYTSESVRAFLAGGAF